MSKRIDPTRRSTPNEPPPGKRTAYHEERNARHDRIAYILGAVLIVFGLMTGAVAFTMVRSHTYNPVVGIVNYFVPTPESQFGKERIFLLLMGLDYDYDKNDEPTSKDSRTDKIEAFALDFPTKVIKSVAVPRDMDAIVNGHEDKINDAYHYGGPANTNAVVGNFLGMAKNDKGTYFDRYVTLRINTAKDLVNAVGGIDVPVTETLNYDDTWGHLHIHFKPGMTHMNGDEAVSYGRFRHDACSDPCRIKRQQQVEKIVLEKIKSEKFNDLAHIGALIDVLHRDVDTDLTNDEMKSLAWHFRDLNISDVHQTQVPFLTDKETSCCGDVLVADTAGLAKVTADFLGPYAAQTPPPSNDAIAAVKPSSLRVDVRNGSGIGGLGAKMADALRHEGYIINSVGNAESFDFDTTQIRASTKTPLAGERIRSDIHLSQAVVTPVPQASSSAAAAATGTKATQTADVTVVVGRDYAIMSSTKSAAPAKT